MAITSPPTACSFNDVFVTSVVAFSFCTDQLRATSSKDSTAVTVTTTVPFVNFEPPKQH